MYVNQSQYLIRLFGLNLLKPSLGEQADFPFSIQPKTMIGSHPTDWLNQGYLWLWANLDSTELNSKYPAMTYTLTDLRFCSIRLAYPLGKMPWVNLSVKM